MLILNDRFAAETLTTIRPGSEGWSREGCDVVNEQINIRREVK